LNRPGVALPGGKDVPQPGRLKVAAATVMSGESAGPLGGAFGEAVGEQDLGPCQNGCLEGLGVAGFTGEIVQRDPKALVAGCGKNQLQGLWVNFHFLEFSLLRVVATVRRIPV